MPTRLYRPVRERATTAGRVMAHEWKFALVAYVWTALGAVLCWTWIDPGGGPVTVISDLTPAAAGAVSVSLLVSGLAVTAGIVWPGSDRVALCLELPALPLGAAAWIAYLAVTDSLIWKIIASGYVLGCALRLADGLLVLLGRPRPMGRHAAVTAR